MEREEGSLEAGEGKVGRRAQERASEARQESREQPGGRDGGGGLGVPGE